MNTMKQLDPLSLVTADLMADACVEFVKQIRGAELREALMRGMTAYGRSLLAGVSMDVHPAVAAAVGLCVLHVGMGTPLHITDDLLAQWGERGVDVISECSSCGYRLPQGYEACVLCGAKTGDAGCFARARAQRAAWN